MIVSLLASCFAANGQSLLEQLGQPAPAYAHIPLLTDTRGRRLAKRDKDLDLTALSRRMTPEAVLGMLAFSCGLRDRPAPASLPELVPDFSWDRIPREDIRLRGL